MLSIAGSVDVDTDGVHGQSVEDGGGQGCVAEVAPPTTELDIRAQSGGGLLMSAVEQVEQRVGGGRLVVVFTDLAEPDVIDDEQWRAAPGAKPSLISAVSETGIKVIDEIDRAGIAGGDLVVAGAQGNRLQ